MTISLAAGPWTRSGSNAVTVSVSPTAVGDLMVLAFSDNDSRVTSSAVSGGGVTTWQLAKGVVGGAYPAPTEIWWGVVTATGASTITLTNSGVDAGDFTRFWVAQWNSSTGGTWSVTTTGSLAGSGTAFNYPSLTGSLLYFGAAAEDFGNFTAGSTTGFTYAIVDGHLMVAYNTAASGTTQPNGVTTDAGASIATVAALFNTASAGVSGSVQPRATVPVPRRRLARGLWGGVQGQAFVFVPAPAQQFRTAPRRVLARAVWRGITGQAFVFVPAPRQQPAPAPRRKPARAYVQFTPVATTNSTVPPPPGTVQPRATIPVPRRRPSRAVWAQVTGQAFVQVPAPRQQPRPAPRRVPARAYVQFTPVATVNAPPAAGGIPLQGIDVESRLIRRYRHMLRRHGMDWEPEVSMLAAPVAVQVPPGWPGTWPVHLPPVEPEPALAPATASAPPVPKWRPVYTRPPKIVRARHVPRDAMMPVWRKTT